MPERIADGHRSLADLARDHLRSAIQDGTYPPGTRLSQRSVADELGMSPIPVREAFLGLQTEGFITIEPRRGAVVTRLEPRDVEEIFEAREAIEIQSALLAARNATDDDLTRLSTVVAASRKAMARDDLDAIREANVSFHDLIVELTHNKVIESIWVQLQSRLHWLFLQNSDPSAICREHDELAEAIISRDEERVRSLAAAHVESSRVTALEVLFGLTQDESRGRLRRDGSPTT